LPSVEAHKKSCEDVQFRNHWARIVPRLHQVAYAEFASLPENK
jgi:hypothetical protein